MFAEHMKRGNPWDDIPFGSSVLRGGGGSDGHNGASASSSSGTCSSEADHFVPIKLMEQKLKNKIADQLNDMDMDFDFDPRQKLNRMDFPERFKQAEEDFRSKVQRAKNNIPPLSERLHRAGSPFRETSHSARAHSPSPSSSSVRHIPIIVEGKQQQSSPSSSTQSPQPKTSSSRNNTPPPKLDPIPMPPPPSHATPEDTQTPSGPKTATADTNVDEPKSENSTAAPPTTDESQSVPPPVKKPAPGATWLEKIEAVSQEVKELEKQVADFNGKSKNKEYLFLDEELTRNLIKLDTIETEGKEDVRNARKACIKLIQKCISDLEDKIADTSKAVSEDNSKSICVRTPPATKTEKPNFTPARKASSEPPYHRSEISIEVNQDEKKPAVQPEKTTTSNNSNPKPKKEKKDKKEKDATKK